MTYKVAGAVCAPTANTLPVVHVVVEAHWIGLIGAEYMIDEWDDDSKPSTTFPFFSLHILSLSPRYEE